MGDDDVTNCCHGDLVFEITSNGKGKKEERALQRAEEKKSEGRRGRDEEGGRKGALMLHVGEEREAEAPYNVRSIQCLPVNAVM